MNSPDLFYQNYSVLGGTVLGEAYIFELCNPSGAQHALMELSEISVYLPCRISVYDNKGTTTLSTIGLEEILGVVEVDERFKEYMIGLFEDLKQVMHSWDA